MIYQALHRWGVSRCLNSSSYDDRGTAYIQTLGPRWLGRRLAVKVLHWSHIPADWDTIRIQRAEHHGRWRYRWHLAYRRLR